MQPIRPMPPLVTYSTYATSCDLFDKFFDIDKKFFCFLSISLSLSLFLSLHWMDLRSSSFEIEGAYALRFLHMWGECV